MTAQHNSCSSLIILACVQVLLYPVHITEDGIISVKPLQHIFLNDFHINKCDGDAARSCCHSAK